jgi:hypothetical protein
VKLLLLAAHRKLCDRPRLRFPSIGRLRLAAVAVLDEIAHMRVQHRSAGTDALVDQLDTHPAPPHQSSPRLSDRASAAARSDAVTRAYLSNISRDDHPATLIKPPSVPPFDSHREAAVCRKTCG